MNKKQFAECPFCGKSDTLTIGKASDTFAEPDDCGDPMPYMHTESYSVTCDASKPDGPGGCGASGGYKLTEDEAIAAWNRRAEVERLAAQAEPAPAPSREVRLLTSKDIDDVRKTLWRDAQMNLSDLHAEDAAKAFQRKFCEVNGLTVKDQS